MGEMGRRAFFKGALSMAGAAALASQADHMVTKAFADPAEESDKIEVSETVDCDVVIVGGGLAGLCAGIRGCELGLDCVILEKLSITGGTSRMAEGMFGAQSRMQRELGFEAGNTDEFFKSIETYNGWTNNPRVCRRWLEWSSKTVDWVEDHGVKFKDIRSSWSTVPTWHVYDYRGSHVQVLTDAAIAAGAKIYTSTPAKQLLLNDDGTPSGVIAVDGSGKGIQFNAKAVIMASGGYVCNRDMVNTYTGWDYMSEEEENLEIGFVSYYGMPGRDGDGIMMGMAAGADTFRLGAVASDYPQIEGPRAEEKDPARCLLGLITGLTVNQDGKRFGDESITPDFVAKGELHSKVYPSYNIVDVTYLRDQAENGVTLDCSGDVPSGTKFPGGVELMDEYAAGGEWSVFKADTIEELAEKMGVNPVALRDTVDRYNGFCEKGRDDDFLKDAQYLVPVKDAPFYAVRQFPMIMMTIGGLHVDEHMRVMKKRNEWIRGLYAIGCDAGGLYGYTYDCWVAAGSQQNWAAAGGLMAIDDIVRTIINGEDDYVPAGEDLFGVNL